MEKILAGVISFFKPKPKFQNPILTDMHSHLLAGIDDGVKTWEESVQVIREFHRLGYRKLITTPHIMSDYYRNEPAGIKEKLRELQEILLREGIDMKMEAAAEYYLDEELIRKVENKERLLTFGDSYLLFETNFLTEPYQLKDFLFQVITQGYKPVLAHPERYQYMTMEKAEELKDRGVLLQVNIPSLIGVYSRPIQKLAEKLIEKRWIDLAGSDCHQILHIRLMEEAIQHKNFKKIIDLPLLNNRL